MDNTERYMAAGQFTQEILNLTAAWVNLHKIDGGTGEFELKETREIRRRLRILLAIEDAD